VVVEAAYELARDMAAKGTLRGGIIAANDFIALAVLKAANEFGLNPGRDFLIIGVDDLPQSLGLGLSTVRVPLEELGREADILLKRVVRHQLTGVQVVLQPQLIARSSSRWITKHEPVRR
jgi:LacI family transcriptional regulator